MADWREVLTVDLVGTALLVDALRPLATDGTAIVCFASISASLAIPDVDQPADAVLDDPLHPDFLDRLREAVGPDLEDSGHGVHLGQAWGPSPGPPRGGLFRSVGARICSVTPGIIDTPMGRQEADTHEVMAMLVRSRRSDGKVGPRRWRPQSRSCSRTRRGYVTGVDLTVDGGVIAAVRSGGLSSL